MSASENAQTSAARPATEPDESNLDDTMASEEPSGPSETGVTNEPEDAADSFGIPDVELPPLPEGEDSFLQVNSESGDGRMHSEGSAVMEKEMQRRLMDVESSFLPEPSPVATVGLPGAGVDDTYLFGVKSGTAKEVAGVTSRRKEDADEQTPPSHDVAHASDEPETPADAYKTPAAIRDSSEYEQETPVNADPSSPAAAAARRTQSRVVSSGDDTQETGDARVDNITSSHIRRPSSKASTVKAPQSPTPSVEGGPAGKLPSLTRDDSSTPVPSNGLSSRLKKRPSYLRNRHSSQRSSASSFTVQSDVSRDDASDGTVEADFALQSGGAVPSSRHRPSAGLSRLPSLASITSAMSSYSDSGDRSRMPSGTSAASGLQGDPSLEPLDEEDRRNAESPPLTPKAPNTATMAPTDTVIAQHVQNIRVPDTIAKEYREKHSRSPDKRGTFLTPFQTRTKSNLTLKEQNSKLDKLSKENFDLKLKIHFLDQALQNRSDEGVKDMISKNVQLQTDLANEKKDGQSLRRKVRDLERKLKAQEDSIAAERAAPSETKESADDSSRYADMEEEITYLRECLQESEVQTEKLREENLAKEADKRRLAEFVKSLGDKKSSEPTQVGEEEVDMWKDLLVAEEARRQQAEHEVGKLHEDIRRLKIDASSGPTYTQFPVPKKTQASLLARSQSASSEVASGRNGGTASTRSTDVDQLKHENAELRRDLGAQTSMLTSRNRERERLQQEIEDLKLLSRRGDGTRSAAGDSILDRSISRAHQRSVSRASGTTRVSQVSDVERDEIERRLDALRDEISQTKILNQELERELNAHLDMLTQAENEVRQLKEERDLNMEDLQALQSERDEALEGLQEKETECENLREEALDTIDQLEGELQQKEQELERLATELDNRNEDFEALQQEMKNVSASLIQIEDDRDASERRIKSLEQELDDANGELESLDKRVQETSSKNERQEVQIESHQNEISFLREEQEGDKIKIGELEAAVAATQTSLQEEKEGAKELEEQMAQERHQREVIGNQEKEEVQKVINDLNQQASKTKDEVRRLRKSLSAKEVEATTWKQRLDELEGSLREALGDLSGTRSSLLKDITKLQRDLDATLQGLESTKNALAEKDRLLRNRDALLENAGLESKKLADLLERERQGRRQDRQVHEQAQRGHQSVARSIQQYESRISELETIRSHERRKVVQLEQQYRDQLLDRNNLLLALWNRLSTLCGADWAQKNSLVSGENPSLEVISRSLPGFSGNLILAVKTVEGIVGGFRARVRAIEKDLWKDYQTLEHTLDVRGKRLDQLERSMQSSRRTGSPRKSAPPPVVETAELTRLRGENKLLKTELQRQQQPSTTSPQQPSPKSASRASVAATLLRHHSTSAVEQVQQQVGASEQYHRHPAVQTMPLQPSEQRWIHRLKELERRLKAEREARLLDRSGARKRLEEGKAENEELRMLYEKEREMRELLEGGDSGDGSAYGDAS